MRVAEVLVIVAMSLFCLLGVFLLSKDKSWQNGFSWLGIFFLLLAVNFLDGILLLNGSILNMPRLAIWEDPLALLYGPMILFFSIQLRSGNVFDRASTYLHFIPFVLMELVVMQFHWQHSEQEIREMLSVVITQNLSSTFYMGTLLVSAHVIGYILLALRTLLIHQARLKQYYASFDIRWAFALVRLTLFIFLLSLVSTAVQYLATMEFYAIALTSLILISIFLTIRVLLFAMNQPILQPKAEPQYAQVNLPLKSQQQLKEQIDHALTTSRLFTNPKLTLKDLANAVGSTDRELSFVINSLMADNFYDLVNHYRIEAAQHIFKTNPDSKLTVLEVLYQVGFNSKSSFNTQFKQKTGLTPSEFKRLHMKRSNK
ncbi:MAG: helix-turn-helix transcriptional regulator [Cyclobacteriaceae bacterium]